MPTNKVLAEVRIWASVQTTVYRAALASLAPRRRDGVISVSYIINLAASTARWEALQPTIEAMGLSNPVRFDAIDGAALGAADISKLQAEGLLAEDMSKFAPGCTPGEIGCVLSHAGVLADIVRKQVPAALVLEDDILLSGSAWTWQRRFRRAYADLPPTWELWYLYRCLDVEHRVRRLTRRTVMPWTPQGGAAYAVTLEGARKLLMALTPASTAVDRVYQEVVRSRRIEAFAASPLLVLAGMQPSVINRNNPSREWIENGINRPPEYWPRPYLDHLGEVAPPESFWQRMGRKLWRRRNPRASA